MCLNFMDKANMSPSPASEHLSDSLEDYLEAILEIEDKKCAARPKDIAQRLKVSPPSVTAALQNLGARGLVNYAPYDVVTLTPRGHRLAQDIRRRHDALKRFFSDFLRLDPSEADDLACYMEHRLSLQAYERLVKLMDFIESCPHSKIAGSPPATDFSPHIVCLGDVNTEPERPADHSVGDTP